MIEQIFFADGPMYGSTHIQIDDTQDDLCVTRGSETYIYDRALGTNKFFYDGLCPHQDYHHTLEETTHGC